tara:strand:+ start:247 stop:855 length:609 start_codon:yes stop_codon:yes gene_type:complete
MDYKFLVLIFVLLILWYFNKSYIIHENNYSQITKQGNNIRKIFKHQPNVPIKKQVEINNNSGVSPKILKYGSNFMIMEHADITLRDMFYYFKLDKSKIDKLIGLFRILDKYEYSHNDLNWRNIMWNNSQNKFQVIDWEFSTPREEKVPEINDDMEYLRYNVYKIAGNVDYKNIELGCKMLENIYNNKGFLENVKGLWLLLKY